MNVGHIVRILRGQNAQLIRRTVNHSATNSTTSQPAGETEGVMVATVLFFAARRTSKF